MKPSDFAAFHEAALEGDEIRHSLLLSIIAHQRSHPGSRGIMSWTLGGPGECAMQTPGYPLVLGNLSRAQCRTLAEITIGMDYPGIIGPGETALHFAERAKDLGVCFSELIPQKILALRTKPSVPSVPGYARQPVLRDFPVLRALVHAFISEAVPADPVPSDADLKECLRHRRHWLWIYESKPVSLAAIARHTRNTAALNSVFTPPQYRNCGFAGAITAFVAREVFSEGRSAACLYADLRNPASNRCYAKLGFHPVCDSWHVIRQKKPASLSETAQQC